MIVCFVIFFVFCVVVLILIVGVVFVQEVVFVVLVVIEVFVEVVFVVQDSGVVYESVCNQLGVLVYCQDKGFIDGKVVEIQIWFLIMILVGDIVKGDVVEVKGKEGIVLVMGVECLLVDVVIEQQISEDVLCKQMDVLLQQLVMQVFV